MKIGIVGAGEIVRNVHLPVLRTIPGLRVAWVYDRTPQRAGELSDAYHLSAEIPQSPHEFTAVDALLLAIPVVSRKPYLLDAAARGLAVLCEKPFAASAAEHQEILAHFPPHRIACGYMRRFYESTRTLRWILDRQYFGPPVRLRYSEGARSQGSGIDGSFLDDPTAGRAQGVLMDLGSHGLDTILHLMRPNRAEVVHSELTLDGTVDRKVVASINLHGDGTCDPVPVDFCVSWLDRQRNLVELHFRNAIVWCRVDADSDVYVGEPGVCSRSARFAAPLEGARNPNQAFFLEWQAFLRGLALGKESEVSATSALSTTLLVEEISESGRASHD